jgi:hypothetical protein
MRSIATTLFFSVITLVLGCNAARPEPEENVGQVDQALCDICSCPRGSECKANGSCGGIDPDVVKFGPVPALCVEDCQCFSGERCLRGPGASYGLCTSCSVWYNPLNVPLNSTTTFSISSLNMPPGAYTQLFGTRDGAWDVNGTVFNLTSGNFTITNSPGLAGTYVRHVVMRGPSNEFLCESPEASVSFQP